MKIKISVSGDNVEAEQVRSFRGFDFRKITNRLVEASMESYLEEACKRATVSLNDSELPLTDYRHLEAIGHTKYWECSPVAVRRNLLGSKRYHVEAINSQPDGYYISMREGPDGSKISVPVRVANLALVRMFPPKRGYTVTTGQPTEAPAPYLYFFYKGSYHKSGITFPKGGHEKYKNNKIGAIKHAFLETTKDWNS